jgi:hypothetical protein
VNILVFGHPGSGKTRLIGTGPTGNKTLILAPPTDHRDSIRGIDMDEWVIRSWAEMLEAQEFLRENNGGGYDWVWLDSISLFQDTGLDDIWTDVIARKPDRARYGLDKAEYGVNMFRLGQWIRYMVGAEVVNLGITAHPFEMDNPFVEDMDEAEAILMPYVQGKNMATKICGYMNVVGYMRPVKDKKTGNYRRVLSVELTERWYGKDQFNAFPNGRMVDPTIPKIMAAIHGQATSTSRSKKGA